MTRQIIRLAAVLAGVVLLGFACERQMPDKKTRSLAVFPTDIKGEPDIRVLVMNGVDQISLSVTGSFNLNVTHLNGREENGGGTRAVSVNVVPTAKGVKLGRDEYKRAEVEPIGNTRLLLNGKPFPGSITFLQKTDTIEGKSVPLLRVIIKLGIEEYLAGVLPNEMQAGWPLEALKAQAVAARSYALYHIKTMTKKNWDVGSTVFHQVWSPSNQTHPRVNMAVNSTVGVVLTENFSLFPTFFHSQCGNRTASGNPVLVKEDITALSGVSCPYCGESKEPIRKWDFTVSKESLSLCLRQAGLMQGLVKKLRPLDIEKRVLPEGITDRCYYIEITNTSGVINIVNANDFRIAVGSGRGKLESTWFALAETADGKNLIFEGYGFGHGVGMCQYGAKYMAERQGASFDSILYLYYPGTKLVRLWGK